MRHVSSLICRLYLPFRKQRLLKSRALVLKLRTILDFDKMRRW